MGTKQLGNKKGRMRRFGHAKHEHDTLLTRKWINQHFACIR